MALDNVTSHFSTVLELIASASFLSSLSIIHALNWQETNCFDIDVVELDISKKV